MMEFLLDFSLFFLKTLTIVAAIVAIIVALVSASRSGDTSHGLTVEKLNEKYQSMANKLSRAVMTKEAYRDYEKARKKKRKSDEKDATAKRVFVLQFKGDMRASHVDSLREEVSAVLAVGDSDDEVVVCLENAGGAVHDHGLAASQLQRIRDHDIPLVVIVDKVAASGGYLMASIANRIIAAPFAIVGSIGVLAQLPNFNRFLENRGIDFEQITAGKYKRTLTMFGKNTDEDRAKTREDLEEVHRLFKGAVTDSRPSLDIDAVATGEYWYGKRALELGLVDELGSSDDYLMKRATDGHTHVFAVTYKGRESVMQKLQSAFGAALGELGVRNDGLS